MTERRLTVAFDCDDVLIPTAEAIVNNYNSRFDTDLNLGDLYKPASIERWGTDDHDEAIERVNVFLRSEEHAQIAPYAEAVIAVRGLAEVHDLHVITGRASFLEHVTRHMIDTHFTGCFKSIEHTNYIVASTDTTALRRSKGEVAVAIGADLLVDDHIAHGSNVMEAGIEGVLVFGDYPWNRQETLPLGMIRCKNWNTVMREIARYAAR